MITLFIHAELNELVCWNTIKCIYCKQYYCKQYFYVYSIAFIPIMCQAVKKKLIIRTANNTYVAMYV